MDTTQAVATLQSMATTLQSNVTGYQAQLDAINLAISQLQGTLTTQLAALDAANAQLATLQAASVAAAS